MAKAARESVFRREPAPAMPANFKAELLRIGGTNDYGQPKLRVVWGGEATWFRAGQIRLKYPVNRKFSRLVGYTVTDLVTKKTFNLPASSNAPKYSPRYLVAPKYEDEEAGYPGWILEEWWPPELVCGAISFNEKTNKREYTHWEFARWYQPVDALQRPSGPKIDLLGEPPTRGEYRFLLYLDEEQEIGHPVPMSLDDSRVLQLIEKAIQLRQDQGAADGWRGLQSPEKTLEMYRPIKEEREKVEAQEEQELDDFLRDAIGSYARKLRHAYLS